MCHQLTVAGVVWIFKQHPTYIFISPFRGLEYEMYVGDLMTVESTRWQNFLEKIDIWKLRLPWHYGFISQSAHNQCSYEYHKRASWVCMTWYILFEKFNSKYLLCTLKLISCQGKSARSISVYRGCDVHSIISAHSQ